MADIEEIENAIETIKCFYTENENCQNLACEMQSLNCKHERELAFKLAIEALQGKLEREKRCEYCKGFYLANASGREFYKAFQHTSDYWTTLDDVTVGIAHDKDGYFLHFEDESGDRMFDVKISSCPVCGRKLGESE